MDSDNTGQIDGTPEEDQAEDKKAGMFVVVNRDDDDNDGILDFADGFGEFGDAAPTAGESDFAPLRLRVPRPFAGTSAGAKVVFGYDAALPSAVARVAVEKPGLDGETYTTHHYTVGGGLLRLWRKDGDESRGEADFIEPGREYSFADLGLSETDSELPLHLEAVNGWAVHTQITVGLVLPGGALVSEVVRVLPLDPLLGIDESEVEGYRLVRGDGSSVVGGSGNDILIGTAAGERLLGMDGDDIILGGRNERRAVTTIDDPDIFAGDTIEGGGGADLIFAWFGNNTIEDDPTDELSGIDGHGVYRSGGGSAGSLSPSAPVAAPLPADAKGQKFSSEDIEAAYAWMYGVDDIWMRGFKELGGQVLAVEQDGRWFSNWTMDWKRVPGSTRYAGYDVKIEYDIGAVLVAASTLREAIMETAKHDFRWTPFFQNLRVESFQDNAVYEAVDEAWATLRDRNFKYAVKVAETAATLYFDGMTLAAGPGGDIADVICSLPDALDGDVGAILTSLLGILPLIPGNIGTAAAVASGSDTAGVDSDVILAAAGPNRFQRLRAAIEIATKRPFVLDMDVLRSVDPVTKQPLPVGFVLRNDLTDAGDALPPLIKPVLSADRSRVVLKVGTAQVSSPMHAETIDRLADEAAQGVGEFAGRLYSHVTLTRSWRTASGRAAASELAKNRLPDLIAVRRDGKIDAYEVMSEGDTPEDLFNRLQEVWETLPAALRGEIRVFPRDPQP